MRSESPISSIAHTSTGPPVLLRSMNQSTSDATGQVHLGRWSRGRVVLPGDAAYCPSSLTGLGTSLALVVAYVLGGELATAGGDHQAALRNYDRVMRPYVAQAQQLPPGGVSACAVRRPRHPAACRILAAANSRQQPDQARYRGVRQFRTRSTSRCHDDRDICWTPPSTSSVGLSVCQ